MAAIDSSAPVQNTHAAGTPPQKHPLNTKWSFWLRSSSNRASNSDWSQTLGHTFGTVEDFWCMINNINNPFESSQVDYSIFRETLVPDYDEQCFNVGGRIILKLANANPRNTQKHFDLYVHLLLALIGENFDDVGGDMIGGLRLVTKRGSVKLEVWTMSKDPQIMQNLLKSIAQLCSPLAELQGRVEFESFDKSVKLSAEPTA